MMKVPYLRISAVLFAVVGLAPLRLAEAQVRAKGPVVATLDNVEITEDELKVEAQTLPLKKQEYEIKQRALENLLALKIIERAAAAKHLSLEEFLKQEVDSKISEPAPAELEGFYWAQKDKFREPFEKVRDQVAQALKQAKIQNGRQALLQKLRHQANVRVFIEPPRLTIGAGNAPRRGSASAPVTIVEYSDYQCPYCKAMEPVLQQLSAKYGDKLSIVYKDFPLYEVHPQAQGAAEAAHCAEEQGKYWDYHDALFAAPDLSPAGLRQAASQVQLDLESFQTCTKARKYKALVDANFREAQQMGAKSTPTFFVNGVALTGTQPAVVFEKLIDAELASPRIRPEQ